MNDHPRTKSDSELLLMFARGIDLQPEGRPLIGNVGEELFDIHKEILRRMGKDRMKKNIEIMTDEELLDEYSGTCYGIGRDSEFGNEQMALKLIDINEEKRLPLYKEILRRIQKDE